MFSAKQDNTFDDKLKSFTQALIQQSEYQSYLKAKADFDNDAEAKKLLSDFRETQQTFFIFRQGNFPGLDQQENKLKLLQRQVDANKNINQLISAQNELQGFIASLVRNIAQEIKFPFEGTQRGGCCG